MMLRISKSLSQGSSRLLLGLLMASTALVHGIELPKESFEKLKSDSFRDREAAQAELMEWGSKRGEPALEEFYRQSSVSVDPEQRERCYIILRSLLDGQFLKEGEGFLGIQMADAQVLVPGDPKRRFAVNVTNVLEDTGALRAGVKPNDLIVSLNKETWTDTPASNAMMAQVRQMRPGEKVTLGILRNGKLQDFVVELGRRPRNADINPMFRNRSPEYEKTAEELAKEAYFKRWLEKRKNAK